MSRAAGRGLDVDFDTMRVILDSLDVTLAVGEASADASMAPGGQVQESLLEFAIVLQGSLEVLGDVLQDA